MNRRPFEMLTFDGYSELIRRMSKHLLFCLIHPIVNSPTCYFFGYLHSFFKSERLVQMLVYESMVGTNLRIMSEKRFASHGYQDSIVV
jgi:hypothetical protein